ncbi:EF hand associated, type-2 [Corchorus capsularis]|uniref:EF hand associated, type-2 n=1 Tax=Corchorus capsularis TaxID=210143 RepID=A0A1R3GLS5_COCAP|nr:EF hand associated, type-2 [Corchorus capsularis]
MGKALTPEGKFGVRVVVAGDQGTGKSSLIVTIATDDASPTNLPPLLPPTRLPENITIIDTSSNPEDRGKLEHELKQADVIVLTYACDEPETFNRLTTFWIPKLRQLESKIPVIIAGLIYPTNPLFDQKSETLTPRLVRALKRIFILCDQERDGVLSDAEFHDFHVKCLDSETPLGTSEIIGVKNMVKDKLPEGVDEEKNGLTLIGFLLLHALFIENGRIEATWNAIRKFGYNTDIKLSDDLIPRGIQKTLIFKREIPEDGVSKVLFGKDLLAACDIAIFVYDSSDESSWKAAAELLEDVAGHGEDTGYEMPCLIVATKSDLDQIPMSIQDSTRNPHLSIPETEDGRSRKENRLRKRSLMVVSIGAAAVAIVGLVHFARCPVLSCPKISKMKSQDALRKQVHLSDA